MEIQGKSEWGFKAFSAIPTCGFIQPYLYWLAILANTAEEVREIIPAIYIAIAVLVPLLYPSLVPFITTQNFQHLSLNTPDVNCEIIICKYTKNQYNNKYMVYKQLRQETIIFCSSV